MNPVRIPLETPIKVGTKVYDHIRVRAPTYGDYMDIGEAITTQRTESGSMVIEHLDRLKAYAERCVTTGEDAIAEPEVLAAGGFRLARQVHEVLCDFLYSPAGTTGTISPTASSSASGGSPTP